ncbi:MAG: LptA/OstA family protein [Candidatus Margulisiibacteriota bacterium]
MQFSHRLGIILCWLMISIGLQANLPFEIEADHIKLKNKQQELYASGNVIIKYKKYAIYSDETIFLRNKNKLLFNNSTKIIDDKNNELTAKSIQINLDNEVGYIEKGYIKTNRKIFINAKNIQLTNDKIIIFNCTITSCTAKTPEWYLESEKLEIGRQNNLINAEKNTIYFYNIPIFFIPSFSQSIYDDDVNNRPTPEFGYNQIDKTFANVYIGYSLTEDISGKVGIGTSTGRGVRYGTTHIYTPQKNHTFTLKTYNVKKTGFEGGLQYQWLNKQNTENFDAIFSTLFIPTENSQVETVLSVEYMYDNASYNELYNALPEVKFEINNLSIYWNYLTRSTVMGGYYRDRVNSGNRYQGYINLEKEFLNINDAITLNQGFNLNLIKYDNNKQNWNRFINYLSIGFPLIFTKNTIKYSSMLYDNGGSPFVFDSINEINQDELSLISTIQFQPIILNFNADYQINDKSFRNLIYSISWVFQCWQIDLNVNTVWEEVSMGVSVPSLHL